MNAPPPDPKVLSVSEVNAAARGVLENGFGNVWVAGEISGFKRHSPSGHCYFNLKDTSAILPAAMWRSFALRLRFAVGDGLAVVARGKLTVYQPRGCYQMEVAELHPQGEGALDLALRQLREKLFARGWFDPKRKRSLPKYPRRIAVVTSPTGAAVRDVLETLCRRWPAVEIIVVPVRVQGDGAAEEIAAAIGLVSRLRLSDVIIAGRGGGSLEDLWAFNEEIVARAIYESAIPVVSAVGHETDVTIADLVADVRALTPTHAAGHVVPDRNETLDFVFDRGQRLQDGLIRKLDLARRRVADLAGRRVFRLPLDRIRDRERRLDELANRLHRAARRRLERGRERADGIAARLAAVSPLNVLARGYSVTERDDGALLRDATEVRPGDRIKSRLHHGRLVSRVEAMEFEPDLSALNVDERG